MTPIPADSADLSGGADATAGLAWPDPASELAAAPDASALSRQLRRLAGSSQAPWLAQEVAQRMAERLSWLRNAPASAALWHATSASLWPDESAPILSALPQPPALWQAGPPTPSSAVMSAGLTALPSPADAGWRNALTGWLSRMAPSPAPATVQLLWSNLNVHHSPDVRATLRQWLSVLADEGVLMFSTLGPMTGSTLRQIFDQAGWGAALPDWVDMHDWGDRLVDAGFSDPVMDQEALTLTYASASGLLHELRGLWGNTHPQRFAGLRTPRWRQKLLSALEDGLRGPDGRLHLPVEVVYGHAVKLAQAPRIEPETRVDLAEMRRQLSSGRRRKMGGH